MLQVCTSGRQGYFHVCDGGSRQYAPVDLFFQMREYQPLPVQVQCVSAAHAVNSKTAARFSGFQQQMNFCIMAQWLIVPHTLHRLGNRLPVENPPRAELHIQIEAIPYNIPQDLCLHTPHQLQLNLTQCRLPYQVQCWVLFLQHPQAGQNSLQVCSFRENHSVSQYALQNRSV